jgi:predicted phosphodiesterase
MMKLHASANEKILFVSDCHKWWSESHFAFFEKAFSKAAQDYQHIVFNGDIFELYYAEPEQVKEGGSTNSVKNAVRQSIRWLDRFIDEHPGCHIHFVLGNHENIRKFRRQLDKLQDKYPGRFEWDPEAIRIGDALITHGHLPIGGKNDEQERIYRVREVESKSKWSNMLTWLETPGKAVVEVMREPLRAAGLMYDGLSKWSGNGKFHCLHKGEREEFKLGWVRHVFFGHTHVKFDNVQHRGILFHNTGSFVRAGAESAQDLGVLQAELNPQGKVRNVVPLDLSHKRYWGM